MQFHFRIIMNYQMKKNINMKSLHPYCFQRGQHDYIVTHKEMTEITREYFEGTIFSIADLKIYTEENTRKSLG